MREGKRGLPPNQLRLRVLSPKPLTKPMTVWLSLQEVALEPQKEEIGCNLQTGL